jgi:FMN phosphatase YigB (HAD superfamily)
MSPRPAVIVFSIESTLAASFQALLAACRQLCNGPFAEVLGGIDPLRLASCIERNRVWFWSSTSRAALAQHDIHSARGEFVCRAFIQLGLDCVEICEAFAKRCFELQAQLMELFPHSRATLHRLSKAGIRHGLIYHHHEAAQTVLHNQGFRAYFDHVLDGDRLAGEDSDELLRRSLALFAVDAGETLLVSNHLRSDLEPAQELGLLTVWVNLPRSGQRLSCGLRPDHIISSCADLAPLLLDRA